MIPAERVIAIARSYIGVRYVHQGRSERGVDCLGLVLAVSDVLKLLPAGFVAPANYGPMQGPELELAVQAYCGASTGLQEAAALATIRWPGHRYAGHIGFVTGPNLIHAYSRQKKVVEHGLRPPWTGLVTGFYRLPGVEYG